MPLQFDPIVLTSTEVTTAKLKDLFDLGYVIKEKIRQSNGTDSLILVKTIHTNRTNATMQHQAANAMRVEQSPIPQDDAKSINTKLTSANQSSRDLKANLTKTFKNKK